MISCVGCHTRSHALSGIFVSFQPAIICTDKHAYRLHVNLAAYVHVRDARIIEIVCVCAQQLANNNEYKLMNPAAYRNF